MSDQLKKLRIQTGVVSRCFKEKKYYEAELLKFEEKLKIKNFASEEDEYRAKLIPQQIDETKGALNDTATRLENAIAQLKSLVEDNGVDESSKEWIAASDKLKEISA
jgi:hypothetical protein